MRPIFLLFDLKWGHPNVSLCTVRVHQDYALAVLRNYTVALVRLKPGNTWLLYPPQLIQVDHLMPSLFLDRDSGSVRHPQSRSLNGRRKTVRQRPLRIC